MSNSFASLTVPPTNGVGAALDASALAGDKTFILDGAFDGDLIIQASQDGANWGDAIVIVSDEEVPDTVFIAAAWLRVMRQKTTFGTPTLKVGALAGAVVSVLPAVPAGNGTGAASSVSDVGAEKTVSVVGVYDGTVYVDASQDGTAWTSFLVVDAQSIVTYKKFVAQYVRVRRAKSKSGTPVVSVASADASSGEVVSPGWREVVATFLKGKTGLDRRTMFTWFTDLEDAPNSVSEPWFETNATGASVITVMDENATGYYGSGVVKFNSSANSSDSYMSRWNDAPLKPLKSWGFYWRGSLDFALTNGGSRGISIGPSGAGGPSPNFGGSKAILAGVPQGGTFFGCQFTPAVKVYSTIPLDTAVHQHWCWFVEGDTNAHYQIDSDAVVDVPVAGWGFTNFTIGWVCGYTTAGGLLVDRIGMICAQGVFPP